MSTIQTGLSAKLARAWEVVRAEVLFLAGAFLKAFLWVEAVAIVGIVGLVAIDIVRHGQWKDAGMLPVAVAYAMFVGFWPAVTVAALRVAWLMAGPWIVLPLVFVPACTLLSVYACSGWIAGFGHDFATAFVAASKSHDLLDIGPAARVGHPIVLLLLPFMAFAALKMIFTEPSVLLPLVLLFLSISVSLLAGLVPSGFVSLVFLLRAYAKRWKARMA